MEILLGLLIKVLETIVIVMTEEFLKLLKFNVKTTLTPQKRNQGGKFSNKN